MSATLKTQLTTILDGSARKPRALQIEALSWVADNWNSSGLAIQAGTGTGKSGIARAIQLATGAAILTPNNNLLKQYGESYPTLNTLMGVDHYPCAEGGDHEDCDSCDYAKARSRAENEPTVYNPLSYIYGPTQTDIVIIDEAHKLVDFLRLVISYRFTKAKYNWPVSPDANWIIKKVNEYEALASMYKERKELKKSASNFQQAKRLKRIANLLKDKPEDFVTYFEGDCWVVEPVVVPQSVIERALGKASKVILLSATIPEKWARRILGHRSCKYLDMPSPIPAENRKIVFDHAGLTAKSSPLDVAQWIKSQLTKHKGNTIVHVTYNMGKALQLHFPTALYHTPTTKTATLNKFKRDGGLWLAAGCSEGVDLPNDYARVNLVPILPFANSQSPLGSEQFKRDPNNYFLETAVSFIQQAGRTTRGVDDWSVTVVGDKRLAWLLKKCDRDLPSYIKKAVVWS